MLPFWVSVGLACLTLSYLLYRSLLPKPIPGIIHDPAAANRILGSAPDLMKFLRDGGNFGEWLIAHTSTFKSPIVQIFMPFMPPALIFSDYRESHDMCLRRDHEFDRASMHRTMFAGVTVNHQITMKTSDTRFKQNRHLVRDLMTQSFLNEVSAPEIYVGIAKLVELWEIKSRLSNDHPFEAKDDTSDAALDIIQAAAFGPADGKDGIQSQLDHFESASLSIAIPDDIQAPVQFSRADRDPTILAVMALSHFIGLVARSPFPALYNFFMLKTPYWRKQYTRMSSEVVRQLSKAEKRLSGENSENRIRSATDHIVKRELIAAEKSGRRPKLYSPTVHDEIAGYIAAGYDTTATLVMWSVKVLSKCQEQQRQFRSQLYKIFPDARREGRDPSAAEIGESTGKQEARYIDAFVEECVRTSSPTPLIMREAIVDTVLFGHPVPKGTAIFILTQGPGYTAPDTRGPIIESSRSESSQKRRDTYPNWDDKDISVFNPARWLKDVDGVEVFDAHAGPVMTFGAGARGCFGRRLAYLELRIIFVMLLWKFQFLPIDPKVNGDKKLDGLTVQPSQCYVRLECVN